MRFIGQDLIAGMISVGAILTLLTVLISMTYGLARLIYVISRDGLLPISLSHVNEKTKTPYKATIVVGVFSAILAGIIPLEQLAAVTQYCYFNGVCYYSSRYSEIKKRIWTTKTRRIQSSMGSILPNLIHRSLCVSDDSIIPIRLAYVYHLGHIRTSNLFSYTATNTASSIKPRCEALCLGMKENRKWQRGCFYPHSQLSFFRIPRAHSSIKPRCEALCLGMKEK